MINQNSNNKPSGFVGRECDAGTPISGKTDNNQYQILRLNTDGTIPIQNFGGGFYTWGPNTVTTAVGSLGANTLISKSTVTTLTAGVYRINPTFIFTGALTGGISFIMYENGSDLFNYFNSIVEGNTVSPGLNDLNSGLVGYWHNTGIQNLGGGLSIAYNRNNVLEINITGSTYYMAMVSEGTVTISAAGGRFGCYEITKLG
jgi:hypothetical protein